MPPQNRLRHFVNNAIDSQVSYTNRPFFRTQMKYAVVSPQIRNVVFKYTDLARADFDLETSPFDTEKEAEEYNNRELSGRGLVVPFADEYMDDYPEP